MDSDIPIRCKESYAFWTIYYGTQILNVFTDECYDNYILYVHCSHVGCAEKRRPVHTRAVDDLAAQNQRRRRN